MLTIATNLPQMLVQPLVAVLVSVFASYGSVFITAIILVLASSFLILPIKKVK